ncbi:MAG: hypothetical protein AB2L14_18040 [Candidatus Xenobiia bacterium LiM19]
MKIAIGDIHTCRLESSELPEKIGPSADDIIIAMGDLFDRGPDNIGIFDEGP